MLFRTLLVWLPFLAAVLMPACAPEEERGRPNIIFVLVDDLRWDDIGCAGHPFVRTPNIDRLAYEGAMFENAFVVTPLCSPSRASFLTGQYPHTHGIIDNTDRSAQSHELITFPRILQSQGYETAYVGKWHMGNDDTARPGFDSWVGMKGQGESVNPELNEQGNRRIVEGYVTDILTNRAVDFIRRPHSGPFLLYLAHKALHPNLIQYDDGSISDPNASHFIPAPRHRDLYADEEIERRPNAGQSSTDKPALSRQLDDLPALGPDTGTKDETIRDRLRMLMAVDEGLGAILAVLEETGELEQTLIVFTGDNGYFYGEHGLSVERRLPYEEGIRIPLLMRYPKVIEPGSRPEAMALSIDFAPTFLEVAGVSVPAEMQGQSLLPILQSQMVNLRDSFLIEYYTDTVFPRVHRMGYQALRTDRYKYIRYKELDGMDELYDLQVDPHELQNLINDPNQENTLEDLRTSLTQKLEETGATQ